MEGTAGADVWDQAGNPADKIGTHKTDKANRRISRNSITGFLPPLQFENVRSGNLLLSLPGLGAMLVRYLCLKSYIVPASASNG